MRTALGITAAVLALGALAVPADAGCVDEYGQGGDYQAFDFGTVQRNPDGTILINPGAVGPDAKQVVAFAGTFATTEVGRLGVLVDCIK